MSGQRFQRVPDDDRRAALERLDRLGKQLSTQRASDIPIEPIDGLENLDGSPVSDIQQALEAICRRLP